MLFRRKRRFFAALLGLVAFFSFGLASAQDIAGRWEGVSGSARRALIVTKAPDGRLAGEFYFLGGTDISPLAVPTISVQDKRVRFALDLVLGYFDGALSDNGNTITGTWRTAGAPQPLVFTRVPAKAPFVLDPVAHKTYFVPVARDVTLEVVDWGGSGPPLIFLPGFANTAHVFDAIAPKLTGSHHVYGITRRGFGRSSAPPLTDANYDAERFGEDVVAVMDALKLDRAVLVGHSLGGSDLSTVSRAYPDRVAGLVYLDAAFWYAFYAPENGLSWRVDAADLRRTLGALNESGGTRAQKRELLDRARQNFLRLEKSYESLIPGLSNDSQPTPPRTKLVQLGDVIFANVRRHVAITSPALMIFAWPERCAADCDSAAAKQAFEDRRSQIAAIEAGLPAARLVRIPDADHYVFRSHEAEVLREMSAFLKDLPPK